MPDPLRIQWPDLRADRTRLRPRAAPAIDARVGELWARYLSFSPEQRTAFRDQGAASVRRRGEANGRGTADDFVRRALEQRGDRYVFGAETNLRDANPNTFDCSELVQWAAAQTGVNIVDGSANQRAACKRISVEEAMRTRGALLFTQGHVAISLGDGRTIEARGSNGRRVMISNAAGRFTSGGLIPGMTYRRAQG